MILSAEFLRSVLTYDQYTGVFIWNMRASVKSTGWNKRFAGRVATSTNPEGYSWIKIMGRRYYAARIAWVYTTGEWPTHEIDHINGIRSDDRFINLRPATHQQNSFNKQKHKNNKSGYKGVCWHKHSKKWIASCREDGRTRFIGSFDTKEDAYSAYCSYVKELHGEFFTP